MGTVGQTATDLILARRSVREGFANRPVSTRDLELIVACGLAAPSSKNAQPWRLHVLRDPVALGSIADAVRDAEAADRYVPHDPATGGPRPDYVSTVAESAEVLRKSPAAIFIENRGVFSGGRESLLAATPGALRGSLTGYGFEMMGLGATVENMWLAANSRGIGATFMGDVVIAEPTIRQSLGICGDVAGVLALGYVTGVPGVAQPSRDQALVVWH